MKENYLISTTQVEKTNNKIAEYFKSHHSAIADTPSKKSAKDSSVSEKVKNMECIAEVCCKYLIDKTNNYDRPPDLTSMLVQEYWMILK